MYDSIDNRWLQGQAWLVCDWAVFLKRLRPFLWHHRFPAAARAVSAVLCPIKQKEDLRSYPDGIAAKARDLPSQSSDVPSIPSHFAYNARTLRGRWVMLGGGYSSLTTEGSSIGVDSGPVSVENIPISVGAQAEAELDERWEKEARRRKRWQEKADEAVRAEKERRGMYVWARASVLDISLLLYDNMTRFIIRVRTTVSKVR